MSFVHIRPLTEFGFSFKGPLASSIITGVMDQSYIPHAIAYAACLGEHAQRCSGGIDNYTTGQVQTACSVPEVSSVSTGHSGGAPVVIASSVMSDANVSNKNSAGNSFCSLKSILFIFVKFVMIIYLM